MVAFIRSVYPTKTADSISADTGIAAATISKWIERSSAPNAVAIFKLIATYGPEFLAAVYPKAPRWLDESVRAEKNARTRAEIERLKRELEASP